MAEAREVVEGRARHGAGFLLVGVFFKDMLLPRDKMEVLSLSVWEQVSMLAEILTRTFEEVCILTIAIRTLELQ